VRMMVTIKSIEISGIRGIKYCPPLNLDGHSVLIFGENGAGKSSLTDAIEWFYSDGIEHLASEELGPTKGRGALRNLFIQDNEDAYVAIQYSDAKLDTRKSINNSFKACNTNVSDDFNQFIAASRSETLILRYRDLVRFIIASKAEKLKTLQDIIGFSEVAETRDILKKSAGRLSRNIKSSNYDNQKNAQQSVILENLGQNAYTNEQLFEGANKLIEPLKLGKKITSLKDIQGVLKAIETQEDTALFAQISFHTIIGTSLNEIVGNVDNINEKYKSYYTGFFNLRKDTVKIKNLQLLALLKEGQRVLVNDVIEEDYCPLCQQGKNKIELITELNARIKELDELEQEKHKSDEQGQELDEILRANINTVDVLLKEKRFMEEAHSKLLKKIQQIKTSLETVSLELKKDLNADSSIKEPSKTTIDKKGLAELANQAQNAAASLTVSKDANIQFQIYTKLYQSITAYRRYQELEKRLGILTKQQITFQALFADFIKRQENALSAFLTVFSTNINDYYTAMNPSENIEGIKLATINDSNDDLTGITIEYKFFNKITTAPHAYLSEGHINCLGLSFFLASVKAFNKKNKFIVFDDVITSIDRSHRARFAKLLTDKLNEYQILLFTHEKDFFDLVSSEVKGKGWLIRNCMWSPDNGTVFEEGIADNKERILKKLADRNVDGLGNDIRIYTEKIMKEIACNIEAQVAFKYNEINEKRMAPELLDAVNSRISKKGTELKDKANIPALKGMPLFIGNTASHDNDFNTNIEDLRVMWEGIDKTVQTFYCDNCKTFVSVKYFDNVANKIRCKCGNLTYDWKD